MDLEQIISIVIILATLVLVYWQKPTKTKSKSKSVEKFDVNQLIYDRDDRINFADFNNRPIISANYGAFDENNRPIVEDGNRLVVDVRQAIIDAQRNNETIRVKNADLTDGVDPARDRRKKLIINFETPVNFTWSNSRTARSVSHPQYSIIRVNKNLCTASNTSGTCGADQECFQLHQNDVSVDGKFFCFNANPSGDFTTYLNI